MEMGDFLLHFAHHQIRHQEKLIRLKILNLEEIIVLSPYEKDFSSHYRDQYWQMSMFKTFLTSSTHVLRSREREYHDQ